ncbi:MAG: non-heme Fe2+,alpha-ketoglutarate-dependent halogenase [Candidatus Latescibacterota bacterium]|jgi:non-heme Fe2+,alpha-ketoglutarate-dependent halogenase
MSKKNKPSFIGTLITMLFMSYVLLLKVLHFPSKWFSNRIKRIIDNWTYSMLWTLISSFGTRAYLDQPCKYKIRTDQPKTIVDDQFKLSPETIKEFHTNGFLGPFTVLSEEEMSVFRTELENELDIDSKTFGFKTVRDRHLDAPFIMDMFRKPEITEVLAQLLGPDILLWRSHVFNKPPGAASIPWHQASTYMLEDYKRPILHTPDKNALFQLTVWIAVDDTTLENGCMEFIPGSHSKMRKITVGKGEKFYSSQFAMDVDLDKTKVIPMPLKPGQFVVFSERCVHGSKGNTTDARRMGINFRAVTPDTSAYANQKKHFAAHHQLTWDLKNWRMVTLRGEDKLKLSKTDAEKESEKILEET